jgi:hypothetical protein
MAKRELGAQRAEMFKSCWALADYTAAFMNLQIGEYNKPSAHVPGDCSRLIEYWYSAPW